MLEITNLDSLSPPEKAIFNALKDIIEKTIWVCRIRVDGTIIDNHSSLEDKLFLQQKIIEVIYSYFPAAKMDAFEIIVYHPSEEELAINEVMEIPDTHISYTIHLNYDISYYLKLMNIVVVNPDEKNHNK